MKICNSCKTKFKTEKKDKRWFKQLQVGVCERKQGKKNFEIRKFGVIEKRRNYLDVKTGKRYEYIWFVKKDMNAENKISSNLL